VRSRTQKALHHFNAGMSHQQHGRLNEAKTAYQRAINADKSLAAAHNNSRFVCLRLEDYASAAKHLHELVKLEPQNAECRSLA
jgi:tetratricopeptide (TPR) repeat protein